MHMQMSICRHSIWFGIQLQKKKTKCWNIPNRKTTITSKRQNKKSSFLVLTKKPVQRIIHYKSIWKVHKRNTFILIKKIVLLLLFISCYIILGPDECKRSSQRRNWLIYMFTRFCGQSQKKSELLWWGVLLPQIRKEMIASEIFHKRTNKLCVF